MEELLKTVTSVKKELQERRNSRLKQHSESSLLSNLPPPSPSLELPLHSYLSNSNLSKASIDKPPKVPYTKLISSNSVKVLQHHNNQPHQRSYKLDAAAMLASRIKGFLRKKFALWVKNIETIKNFDKIQKDSRKGMLVGKSAMMKTFLKSGLHLGYLIGHHAGLIFQKKTQAVLIEKGKGLSVIYLKI